MRTRAAVIVVALVMAMVAVSWAQDNKAAIAVEKLGSFKPGDTIVFKVKLNEPLPKEARFTLRISPITFDEDVASNSIETVDQRVFRVSVTLPENAMPGEWHIKVINLYLPGSGWTQNTITPNDLKFNVEGKSYKIPTEANVTIEH